MRAMGCSSMTIPTIPATSPGVFKEFNGLRRSESGNDLCTQSSMRRSQSDNHLCYSINRIRSSAVQPKLKNSRSFSIFPFQLPSSVIPNSIRSFLLDLETSKDMDMDEKDLGTDESLEEEDIEGNDNREVKKRANWVERLLELRSYWRNRQQSENLDFDDETYAVDEDKDCMCYDDDESCCDVDYSSDQEDQRAEMKYDRETFSRFLTRVPWSDVKPLSKLAFLCNMAYVIPDIKPKDLRRYYGLRFVTSSLEKKTELAACTKAKLGQDSVSVVKDSNSKSIDNPEHKSLIHPSVAYEIAASAASYVQSRAKGLLSKVSQSREGECRDSSYRVVQTELEGESSPRVCNSEVAAYVAASTMTAVVAAGEKEKQEAARNLQSLHSSPCEWFVCDDFSTYTRCFVIQGSDSLASWQANLFFEPAKFEETEVLVHRGIYEAAKGIYEQFMHEIIEHLNRYGERAKLQFTGHSLGGSLSLLVSLMLLSRKVVKPSTLRPVVTFGSPFILCGGQQLLKDLGLDESHVHSVMMHRDIVPRAFSCNYPNHVASLLKRLSGTFQSHPCLNKNKLLYSPFGKLLILQPDEKSSPPHPLLPRGNALYAFGKTQSGEHYPSALKAFLNCPHPLETLSAPTAYGSEGTILRDHDSSNYLKAVNGVLRQNTRSLDRHERKPRTGLWPLLNSPSPHSWDHGNHLETRMRPKEIMSGV